MYVVSLFYLTFIYIVWCLRNEYIEAIKDICCKDWRIGVSDRKDE